MVRIGPAGERALQNVKDAKASYDSKIRELDAEYRVKRDMLRYGVTEAVRAAIREGVPNRQVALKGLGYADVGSLKRFLDPSNTGTASSAEALTVAPKGQPITYVKEERKFLVTDSKGVVHRVPFFFQEEGVPYKIVKYALHKMSDDDAENTQRIISQDFPDIEWED
jgi:hypothetical protein